MKASILVAALCAVLILACGGGGGEASNDRVLHFSGRDETEGNFRARIRDTVNDGNAAGLGILVLCRQVRDLKPNEALIILRDDNPDGAIPEGAKAKPGQKAEQTDLIRSAEIFQEECRRAL